MGIRQFFADRLTSLVESLSFGAGKVQQLGHVIIPLSQAELTALYRDNWMARKAIDIPVKDMTREGRAWEAKDDQITAFEGEAKRVGLYPKLARAMRLARLYGGAGLILGVDDGQYPTEPLDYARVKKGGLKYIYVFHRYQVSTGELIDDPTDAYCGEPSWYELPNRANAPAVKVHPSRVVKFIGKELPDNDLSSEPWGDSNLQAINETIVAAGLTWQGIADLVMEAKVDIYKIDGLTQKVSDKAYRDRLVERVRLSMRTKSINNALIVDKNEEYEQKQVHFAGLVDILDKYVQLVAGAADIPVTRFLGEAPSGLNSTGESDIRNYYDGIAGDQEELLNPAYDVVDPIIWQSALGTIPTDVYYTHSPLWQLSEKEISENRERDAKTADTYAKNGLVPKDALRVAVQNQLVEEGTYSGLEAALKTSKITNPLSAEEIKSILDAKGRGLMRKEDIYELFLGAGLIKAGTSYEQWSDDLDTEGSAAIEMPLEIASNYVDPENPKGKSAKKPTTDAAPRSLYIYREVVNAAVIKRWAKAQGFDTVLDNLHVTVIHSRTPVDWIKMGDDGAKVEIEEGGPRLMETFGEAIVLQFASYRLRWRNEQARNLGASFDYEEYQPHITITYKKPAGLDLSKVEPYQGEIILGPEHFEEVDEDWEASES